MRRTLAALVLMLAALAAAPSRAQTDLDRETVGAIRELLDKTGSLDRYNQMIDLTFDQMIQSIRAINPGRSQEEVAAAVRDILLPEFRAIGPAMIELSVLSYARRFSLGEIRELSAFYDTPIGQKMLRELPGLMTEVTQAAGPIVNEVTRRAIEKNREPLRQRGIQIPL